MIVLVSGVGSVASCSTVSIVTIGLLSFTLGVDGGVGSVFFSATDAALRRCWSRRSSSAQICLFIA